MLFIMLVIAAVVATANAQVSGDGSGSVTSLSSPSSNVEVDTSVGLYSYVDTANAKAFIVGIRNTTTSSNYCSGVLIAPKFVLTSNLCQPDPVYQASTRMWMPEDQYASIGALARSGAPGEGDRFKVVKKTVHPDYNLHTHEYDFAILELDTASKKTPALLPTLPEHDDPYGLQANVYGWNLDDDSAIRTELLTTTMKFVNRSVCDKTVKTYYSHVCMVGTSKTDACHINVGSPIIYRVSGKDHVVGIVALRTGCNQPGVPTLFSRISRARTWFTQVAGV